MGQVLSTFANKISNFDEHLGLPLTKGRNQLVENVKPMTIQRTIDLEDSNVSGAVRRLGIHRQSLQQKIKQLGMR